MRVSRRLKDLQGPINEVVAQLSAQRGRAPRPSDIAARLNIPAADVVEAVTAAQAYRPASLDGSHREEPDAAALTDTLGAPDPGFELFTETHSLAPHRAALPARDRTAGDQPFPQLRRAGLPCVGRAVERMQPS
jgi:RNA polymerase sigma-B factor